MKKLVGNIVVLLIVITVTWSVKGNYFPNVQTVMRSDTTYVNRPYEIEVVKEVEVPREVVRYETVTDTIETVKVVRDTVYVQTQLGQTYTYGNSFLTQYPDAHKFLSLQYNEGDLSITTQSPNGVVDQKTWGVGRKNYFVGTNVNLRTSQSWFVWEYSASVGWIQWWDTGSPYIQASGEFRIFKVPLEASININKDPFVMGGINYEF